MLAYIDACSSASSRQPGQALFQLFGSTGDIHGYSTAMGIHRAGHATRKHRHAYFTYPNENRSQGRLFRGLQRSIKLSKPM